jgi:hypothetical protein
MLRNPFLALLYLIQSIIKKIPDKIRYKKTPRKIKANSIDAKLEKAQKEKILKKEPVSQPVPETKASPLLPSQPNETVLEKPHGLNIISEEPISERHAVTDNSPTSQTKPIETEIEQLVETEPSSEKSAALPISIKETPLISQVQTIEPDLEESQQIESVQDKIISQRKVTETYSNSPIQTSEEELEKTEKVESIPEKDISRPMSTLVSPSIPQVQPIEIELDKPEQGKSTCEGFQNVDIIQTSNDETPKKSFKPYVRKTPDEDVRPPEKKSNPDSQGSSPSHRTDLGELARPDRGRVAITSGSSDGLNYHPSQSIPRNIIESPYIELDLINCKVFLVIPEQKLEKDDENQYLEEAAFYDIFIDGKSETVNIDFQVDNKDVIFPEIKLVLEKPFKSFQINYPKQLGSKQYTYEQIDKYLFIFVRKGSHLGKMYPLYTEKGIINPIPEKAVWILLHSDFNLETELGSKDIIEEAKIWGYRCFGIDFADRDCLIITNKFKNEKIVYGCGTNFCLEGVGTVIDDLDNEFPIITGNTLTIRAPHINESGWQVLIQAKSSESEASLISEKWTGLTPLVLPLPGSLPADSGKFQISFCQQNTRLPDKTLFFRWAPGLKLEYPNKLIIPDTKAGHGLVNICASISNLESWHASNEAGLSEKQIGNNSIQYCVPPEVDILKFFFTKNNAPETEIRFQLTIPRLKWRIISREIWESTPIELQRNELEYAKDLNLELTTNDPNNKYDIKVELLSGVQLLQELSRRDIKNSVYSFKLNAFFDTINKHDEELKIFININSLSRERFTSSVNVINIKPRIYFCKINQCEFSGIKKDLIDHIIEEHLDELFPELTYFEIRDTYNPKLPAEVYKCPYCNYYAQTRNVFTSATSEIYNHIASKHGNDKGELPEKAWAMIRNANEIRQYVIKDLPFKYKCIFCGKHFDTTDPQERFRHILKDHRDSIFNS